MHLFLFYNELSCYKGWIAIIIYIEVIIYIAIIIYIVIIAYIVYLCDKSIIGNGKTTYSLIQGNA